MSLKRTRDYIHARSQHPAWLLLASRRAPLVLGCLQTLFEHAHNGIPMADALQALADMLTAHANHDEYEIDTDNTPLMAGRELRSWIKRGLIIEREDRLYATDALETALQFVEGLDNRMMTSTASRLSTVQREIESLESHLNPNAQSRIANLQRRIAQLESELEAAHAGDIPVLDETAAIEGIREIFNLATSLRADFRRVEDSWRQADKALRQSIISEQDHRGAIVDRLLDGHDALLDTPEGRVFDAFQLQLRQSNELDLMRERLRVILKHPGVHKALNQTQQRELRWLVMRLVEESQAVFQAKARSEKDVKGFLKTGLAAEHHRVGNLLNAIFHEALNLDWQKQAIRRQATILPPIGIALAGLALVERLRFKSLDNGDDNTLDLNNQKTDLRDLGEDFWAAFDGLDRDALVQSTLNELNAAGKPLSLAQLAERLPPTHDLETFALWLDMAKEAGIPIIENKTESIELTDNENHRWRFHLPLVTLKQAALEATKKEEKYG